MLFIFVYLIISLSFSMFFLLNPLMLSLFILAFSLLLSVNLGLLMYSWFSFIVFLIYISGMMVMFSYFVVLQPNQYFNFNFFFFFFFLSMMFMIFYMDFTGLIMLNNMNWMLSSLYIMSNNIILLMMGILLLMILLAIVKITFINRSSLRPFM